MCTDGSIVVRVDEKVSIRDVHLDQEIYEELKSYCFEPTYIMTRDLPGVVELESVPVIADDDANVPAGGGVDKYAKILERGEEDS